MEIPGLASFNNQPTLTRPLSSNDLLEGRQVPARQDSETVSAQAVDEQGPASLDTSVVVNEVDQAENGGFNPANPGGTIDFTA